MEDDVNAGSPESHRQQLRLEEFICFFCSQNSPTTEEVEGVMMMIQRDLTGSRIKDREAVESLAYVLKIHGIKNCVKIEDIVEIFF